MKAMLNNKICVITSVHPVLDKRIFNREILSLKKFGFEIDLIAPSKTEIQVIQGVKVLGIPKRRKAFRFLNWFRILRLALKDNYAVYHFHDPDLIFIAPFLKIFSRKAIVYDVHEHDVDELLENVRKSVILKRVLVFMFAMFLRLSIRFIAKFINNIIVVEDSMKRYYDSLGCNVLILYNFAKKTDFLEDVNYDEKRKVILHTGTLGVRRGSLMLLEIAAIVAKKFPDWMFVFTEQYYLQEEKDQFFNELAKKRLGGAVKIIPRVKPLEMWSILKDASIGLSPLFPEGQTIKAIPSKFFEYMAAGLVIVASDLPYSRKFVEDNGVGILCGPYDANEYAESIIGIIEDPALRKQMARKARKLFLEKYNWEAQENAFYDYYCKVIKES